MGGYGPWRVWTGCAKDGRRLRAPEENRFYSRGAWRRGPICWTTNSRAPRLELRSGIPIISERFRRIQNVGYHVPNNLNSSRKPAPKGLLGSPLRIAVIYFAAGILWLGVANLVLQLVPPHSVNVNRFVFTCVTGMTLYLVASRYARRLHESVRAEREAASRARAFFESAVEGIVQLNSDGSIRQMNPRALRCSDTKRRKSLASQSSCWCRCDCAIATRVIAQGFLPRHARAGWARGWRLSARARTAPSLPPKSVSVISFSKTSIG